METTLTISDKISEIIEEKRDTYIHIANEIWNYAELRFNEHQSSALLIESLKAEGFDIETNIGGFDTAFIGSWGKGNPVIAFLGEYDALSGLDQEGGITEKKSENPNGNGHGCGHNLLGTGSLAAAVATKEYMEQHNISGTVRYYGCPVEEGGSGKTFIVRAGAFQDVDIALCWHPADVNVMLASSSLANIQATFKFKGKASHAATAPHLGRSALDAVELMNVGTNYLREHIIPEARIHYAITNSGGISPNIVQQDATVLYLIRAPKTNQVNEIYERICKVAQGAALMTETEMEIIFEKACSNIVPNHLVQQVMYEQFIKLGTPSYSKDELKFAEQIRNTLSVQEKSGGMYAAIPLFKETLQKEKNHALTTSLFPYQKELTNVVMPGSTDVGDVSWVVPTTQCTITCFPQGTQLHSWQVVATGCTSIAHKGMLHAGKVLAATAIQLVTQPKLIEHASLELKNRIENNAYQNPIPNHIQPQHIQNQITDLEM
ncbi:M20 family metallopeptidase [Bacillus sp. FJAT-42315]|uniref:M20 family metallopeptidase n=1 Tax=Bacillus sp. FJAT-42315 TaxID=2014077 RepID=UPI000C242836|nr:M20 family metallopeptidase [Bacillus sp. FJAT-42315]